MKMSKGIVQALAIPIVFTIILLTVVFVSLKANIIKAVDTEVKLDTSQSVLQSFFESTYYDTNSGREQSLMEAYGENYLGIGGVSMMESIPESLSRYKTLCSGGVCTAENIAEITALRLNQLVFSTCYRIHFDNFEFGGSQFKSEEAKQISGKADCDLKYPAVAFLPLPYNPSDLVTEVRLTIE
jgi:hypothetical protein